MSAPCRGRVRWAELRPARVARSFTSAQAQLAAGLCFRASSVLLVSRLECAVFFRARLRFGVCSWWRSAYRPWLSRYSLVCPAYPESNHTREPWSVFVDPAIASVSSLASALAMPAPLESRECKAAVPPAPAVAPFPCEASSSSVSVAAEVIPASYGPSVLFGVCVCCVRRRLDVRV